MPPKLRHCGFTRLMRRCCASLVFPWISGCTVAPFLVYLPEDVPVEWLGGGCPQKYRARLFEKDGVTMDFMLDPEHPLASPLQGSLLFHIPKRHSAKFLDSRVTIAVPSYSKALTADLYSCPQLYRSTHTCFWDAPQISNEKVIVLTLPSIMIDDSRNDLKPVRFSLQRKWLTCWLIPPE